SRRAVSRRSAFPKAGGHVLNRSPMDGASWRIELLGGLRARLGDRVVDRFPTRKTAALLAYLAYHREPAPRERLVDLLWPRASASAGRTSLRKALSSLRRLLEPPGVGGAGSVIEADKLAVRLRHGSVRVDALELSDLAPAALRERDPAKRS